MFGYSSIITFPFPLHSYSSMLDIVTLSFSLQIFVSFIYMLFAVIPISLFRLHWLPSNFRSWSDGSGRGEWRADWPHLDLLLTCVRSWQNIPHSYVFNLDIVIMYHIPLFSVFHCIITITRILYTSFLHNSTHLLFP